MAKINESNGKGNGNARNGKFKGGKNSFERKPFLMDKCDHNSPSYYNKNADNYKDTMSIPWFKLIGAPTGMEKCIPDAISSKVTTKYKEAGIMAIDIIPTIGACPSEALAPVNKCFTMIYNELAAKTANANIGFQMPDLAMYLISMSSVQALIAYLKKVLNGTNFWRTKNLCYPKALTAAHGCSWQDISNGRTRYVTKLNDLIHMFNSMAVPHFTEVFDRQYALMNTVFVDEDDDFGQLYTFRPKGYFKYVDTSMKCEWTPIDYTSTGASYQPFDYYLTVLEEALGAWYGSDDYRTINGAIIRAFQNTPVYTISDVKIDDAITPSTDEYFLMQIMNMDVINYDRLSNLDITQSDPEHNGLINWEPLSTDPKLPMYRMQHFLRAYKANINMDDNCEMTRFCTVWSETADPNIFKLESSGTEIVVGLTIYTVNDTATGADPVYSLHNNFDMCASGGPMVYGASLRLNAYRYLPFIPVVSETDEGIYELLGLFGDSYNYTTLDSVNLMRMHEVCMYSVWKPVIVPKVY